MLCFVSPLAGPGAGQPRHSEQARHESEKRKISKCKARVSSALVCCLLSHVVVVVN